MDLIEFLHSKQGRGKRYSSISNLSLAISELGGSANQNTVSEIGAKGLRSLERVANVATATETSRLRILMLAGFISEEEVEEISGRVLRQDQLDLLGAYESLQKIQRETALRVVPQLRVLDEDVGPPDQGSS